MFTVGTRTVTGIKSPTMVGIGRGGKILSRDCDIIIADDIEDHSSTMQPASRETQETGGQQHCLVVKRNIQLWL